MTYLWQKSWSATSFTEKFGWASLETQTSFFTDEKSQKISLLTVDARLNQERNSARKGDQKT